MADTSAAHGRAINARRVSAQRDKRRSGSLVRAYHVTTRTSLCDHPLTRGVLPPQLGHDVPLTRVSYLRVREVGRTLCSPGSAWLIDQTSTVCLGDNKTLGWATLCCMYWRVTCSCVQSHTLVLAGHFSQINTCGPPSAKTTRTCRPIANGNCRPCRQSY